MTGTAPLSVPAAPASASPQARLVSTTSRGIGAKDHSLQPSLSGNARYVAFKSDANNSISATGRFVTFQSEADNLSRADDNSVLNIFVRGPLT